MSVNEKMKALANEVRRLSGAEGKLGIEAMTEKLAGVEVGGSSEKFRQVSDGTITEITSEDLAGATTLSAHALRGRSSLRSIKIKDTAIRTIGEYALYDLPNLEELELPKGLITAGYDALGSGTYNYVLTKLIVPKTVTTVGFEAFNSFKALKTIEFEEGSEFVTLGNYSISGMTGLTHIKFLKALTWCSFSFCNNCPSLQYLDFTSVNKISALGSTSGVFGGSTPSTAKVIVPASLYDTWIKATNWATFADRIVPDTIDGTWVFNDTISWEITFAQSVNFNTNNEESKVVLKWSLDNTNEGNFYLRYGTTHKAYSTNTQMWTSNNYKTVDFGSTPQTCNAEFIAFMYHNATKQEG